MSTNERNENGITPQNNREDRPTVYRSAQYEQPSVFGGSAREARNSDSGFSEDHEQGGNLFAVLSDRLSGRWPHAIALGLILAVGCAVLGYRATSVRYDAVGIIQVSPKIKPLMRETPETGMTPHYANHVETEARMVTSNPRILERALQQLDLDETPWETIPQAMRALQSNLSAKTERNTELIYVSYRAESPQLAQKVANSVLRAYDEIRGSVERDEHARRINELRAERARYNEQWRQKNSEILDFIASTGYAVNDFRTLIESREAIIQDIENDIRQLEEAQEVLVARAAANPAGVPSGEGTVSERDLEAFDRELAELGQKRRLARLEYARAQARLKPEHAAYAAAKHQRDLMNRLYRDRAEEVMDDFLASGYMPAATSPDEVGRRIDRLKSEIQEHRQVAQQMGKWQSTVGSMRAELTQIEQWRADIDYRIRQLDIEADQISAGRIRIAAMAEYPLRPAQDRRRPLAAIGAMGGFGMSFAIFFMLGMVDRRVFAVRQITSAPSGSRHTNGRLLGVLPALPKRPGDVESASVAAHCVHQIRNHVEASRKRGGPVVLVTSSPYQGDGKTSLVMALGASYAATGRRVLLVDCDLVGKNLTAHAMMSGQPGLRETLLHAETGNTHNGGDPFSYIASISPVSGGRQSASVSVLPVGNDPTVGPEIVQRERLDAIFDRLREKFDVILVDTGPLFGSIESLPAAAAADGVILTMQRGRRHARLQECVEELQSIGANYLGLVLNHARISDCDRYVSKSRISAVVTAHEADHQSNGTSGRDRNGKRPPMPRTTRNALLRAMQVTSRVEH